MLVCSCCDTLILQVFYVCALARVSTVVAYQTFTSFSCPVCGMVWCVLLNIEFSGFTLNAFSTSTREHAVRF